MASFEKETGGSPEVRHDDDITPYTAPPVDQTHLDKDKDVFFTIFREQNIL
jgi:hypothetical protein